MPGPYAAMRWTHQPFNSGFTAAARLSFEAGLGAYIQGYSQRVEQYAKTNAPWEDRTGDARAGLEAKGYFRLTSYEIVLYHTVDYGVYLELRWSGRYAIIMETLEVMGRRLMNELEIARMMKGAVT